jgi:hypothetical protein
MKTKDVLLVVGGVALGYYASKMNWGKNTASAVGNVASGVVGTATGVVTDVKDVAVDTVKTAECEAKLLEQTKTIRLTQEGMASFRTKFMAECLAS